MKVSGMKSIIQTDRNTCYLCGRNSSFEPLDEHHVYGGLRIRDLSERYGLKVYLHHWTCHLNGVHKGGALADRLKADVQQKAMEHYGWSKDDFIGIFGKSYV